MWLRGVVGGICFSAAAHASPLAHQTGTTVEAELGGSYVHVSCHDTGCGSGAYPFLVLGGSLGWWVAPRLAVQLRLFDLIAHEAQNTGTLFLCGPGFQYWPDERVWVGAAAGVDTYVDAHKTAVAAGFDFRVGVVAFASHAHALSVSAEVSPIAADETPTTFALLIAYQHL